MAGIKETKESLSKQILDLYHRFVTTNPEQVFSVDGNETELHDKSELAAQLAKRLASLANLVAIEEDKIQPFITIPEVKVPETIIEIPAPEIEIPLPASPEILKPEETVQSAEIVIPEVTEEIIPIKENSIPEKETPPVMNEKTYPDLKTLIGFNEKLMFTRQLFSGNNSDYDDAIVGLNKCNSFAEANAILMILSSTYKWSKENEPVQVFHAVVKRRFA